MFEDSRCPDSTAVLAINDSGIYTFGDMKPTVPERYYMSIAQHKLLVSEIFFMLLKDAKLVQLSFNLHYLFEPFLDFANNGTNLPILAHNECDA